LFTSDTYQQYDQAPGIRATDLKLAHKSIQLYGDSLSGVYHQSPTRSLSFGTLAHTFILQPDEYHKYCVSESDGPINPSTGQIYGAGTKKMAEWEQLNPGKVIASRSDEEKMCLIYNRMPIDMHHYLSDDRSEFEVSLYCGIYKIRLDIHSNDCIVDLKSIADIDNISQSIYKYKYWMQYSFYRHVYKLAFGHSIPFKFAFFETSPPFRWRIVELDTDYQLWADENMINTLTKLELAIKCENFIDESPIEKIVSLPNWLQNIDIDDEEEVD
jgi:exodeoxyribonuclease VIII